MFVHLRVYSDYSLLKSTIKVEQLVKLAAHNTMPAVALTDSNNLSGAFEFSEHAIKHGVQPIFGCNIDIENQNEHNSKMLLLIQNERGYKNLLQLIYQSSVRTISLTDFKNNTDGLIALTGGILSKISIRSNTLIEQLITTFPNNLYIELQRCTDYNQKLEMDLIDRAYQYNLPLVATSTVLFATQDDHKAHDALTCISTGSYIADEKRERLSSDHYFRSSIEMKALFSDIPEAIANTITIAQRCCFLIEQNTPILPHFPCETDENDEITNQTHTGLKLRLNNNIPKNYLERAKYELKIITSMGYSGYFLIVSDFIKWSKGCDIPVGPGRGSGVGSIVAWALQITNLDPIKFNLIFERFLNPDRISMPDFDIDFCQQKRHLVINYIHKKYTHVAQIITFGNLQPRAVLRDVGRILQIPYFQVDKICKMIPNNPAQPVSLAEAIALDTELQKTRDNDETIHELLAISLKLEGLHRHSSTHAAGIVINSTPLVSCIPIEHDQVSELTRTQYSMKYIEKAGLVKFDFLGLKTLTLIQNTCKLLQIDLDINTIPINDRNTFQLLSDGDSVGVFQLENAFMQQTLKKLKPDLLEDIIALISLNRPGPMDNIPMYISRKHGLEEIEYLHPRLEDCLKQTFGVIIYQEQVMEIARTIAGYTLSAADILRRAMGKKIKSEMNTQQDIFIAGSIKNGISRHKADYIFNLVAKFAGYGFNKSHAAAYALISYQTAYLKANHLIEFLIASMNLEINDTDKLLLFCNEAKQHGIKILPPDINKSKPLFTREANTIRYGLAALKNVGIPALKELCARQYKHINDFINNADINKRAIESLAKAGAFDSIHKNRQQIYKSAAQIAQTKAIKTQGFLFDDKDIQLLTTVDWDTQEKSSNEYNAIGFYLMSHPIDQYKKILENIQYDHIVTGIITKIQMRSSKRGRFCTIVLSHPDKIYDIAFYDQDVIEEQRDLFLIGQAVAISMVQSSNGLRGNTISTLDHFIASNLSKITLYLHNHELLPILKNMFTERGHTSITLRVRSDDMEIDIELPHSYQIKIASLLNTDGLEIISE